MIDIIKEFSNINILKNTQKKVCKEKIRYETLSDAENALFDYTDSILFSNMDLYHCRKHNCFHLGHNKRMSQEDVIKRSNDEWNRLILSNS